MIVRLLARTEVEYFKDANLDYLEPWSRDWTWTKFNSLADKRFFSCKQEFKINCRTVTLSHERDCKNTDQKFTAPDVSIRKDENPEVSIESAVAVAEELKCDGCSIHIPN